jgi:hypothetical protein
MEDFTQKMLDRYQLIVNCLIWILVNSWHQSTATRIERIQARSCSVRGRTEFSGAGSVGYHDCAASNSCLADRDLTQA